MKASAMSKQYRTRRSVRSGQAIHVGLGQHDLRGDLERREDDRQVDIQQRLKAGRVELEVQVHERLAASRFGDEPLTGPPTGDGNDRVDPVHKLRMVADNGGHRRDRPERQHRQALVAERRGQRPRRLRLAGQRIARGGAAVNAHAVRTEPPHDVAGDLPRLVDVGIAERRAHTANGQLRRPKGLRHRQAVIVDGEAVASCRRRIDVEPDRNRLGRLGQRRYCPQQSHEPRNQRSGHHRGHSRQRDTDTQRAGLAPGQGCALLRQSSHANGTTACQSRPRCRPSTRCGTRRRPPSHRPPCARRWRPHL